MAMSPVTIQHKNLPGCRRLLFPLLQAEKERLCNAIANRDPASCWQGIQLYFA